jgi:hypothetical protein
VTVEILSPVLCFVWSWVWTWYRTYEQTWVDTKLMIGSMRRHRLPQRTMVDSWQWSRDHLLLTSSLTWRVVCVRVISSSMSTLDVEWRHDDNARSAWGMNKSLITALAECIAWISQYSIWWIQDNSWINSLHRRSYSLDQNEMTSLHHV